MEARDGSGSGSADGEQGKRQEGGQWGSLQLVKFPDVSQWSTLRVVDVSNNKLSALPDLRGLTTLTSLNVSRNELRVVARTSLPSKLKLLDVSHNEELLCVEALPSALALFSAERTPLLGFPPPSSFRHDSLVVKGAKLKALKRWMYDAATEPTHRLYVGSTANSFVDFTVGNCTDAIVQKPNEDRITLYFSLFPSSPLPQCGFVRATNAMLASLFDGHLGIRAADYAVSNLQVRLKKAGLFAQGDQAPGKAAGEIMARVIQEMDDEMCEWLWKAKYMDGSTLCTVFVDSNALLTACWLGDSRAVLVHNDGSVTGLTRDHKPYHDDEEKRIIASGGFVEGQRVNGVLAMSRSLGDVPLKRPNKAVSNEPSVTTRQLTPNDAFIVIASDGLFDVVSNNFVGRTCKKKGKAVSAAADLMYHARMQGTRDNTSVIVIRMDWSSGCSISSTDNNNNNN